MSWNGWFGVFFSWATRWCHQSHDWKIHDENVGFYVGKALISMVHLPERQVWWHRRVGMSNNWFYFLVSCWVRFTPSIDPGITRKPWATRRVQRLGAPAIITMMFQSIMLWPFLGYQLMSLSGKKVEKENTSYPLVSSSVACAGKCTRNEAFNPKITQLNGVSSSKPCDWWQLWFHLLHHY